VAAVADADALRVEIDDGILVAPRRGRVQYRMAEPGEVLPPGGRVLDMIDLTDVYMLFYLPEAEAGKVPSAPRLDSCSMRYRTQ
jgi:HlyD family secretion protein